MWTNTTCSFQREIDLPLPFVQFRVHVHSTSGLLQQLEQTSAAAYSRNERSYYFTTLVITHVIKLQQQYNKNNSNNNPEVLLYRLLKNVYIIYFQQIIQ